MVFYIIREFKDLFKTIKLFYGRIKVKFKIKNKKQENNSLEYLNELVQKLSNKEIEISQNHEQIAALEKQAIAVHEKGEVLRKEAKELVSQVQSWLKEYGEGYNLNYKGEKCVEIEKQVKDIQRSIERAEERSLDASDKALKKVEKAKRLTNEYNGLKGEYMKYIHEKDVEPEPENVEDKEDVVEEEEKEEKEEE